MTTSEWEEGDPGQGDDFDPVGADPPLVTRLDPRTAAVAGIHLRDGFSSGVGFQLDPTFKIWEKSVTPPAVDGGDPIDQTTMWNRTWRTQWPRSLKSMGEITFTGAYDPHCYVSIIAMINVVQSVLVDFPDRSSIRYWGYLQKVEFAELQEGEQPECTVTVQPVLLDPSDLVYVGERGPIVVSVPGT